MFGGEVIFIYVRFTNQEKRKQTFLRNGNWILFGVAVMAHQKGFVLLTREWSGSRTKYIWQCPKGHKWRARIDTLVKGKGCPVCYDDSLLTSEERIANKKKNDKRYYQAHKKEKRIYDRLYSRKRLDNDPIYKLRHNIRARFRMAIKHKRKSGSAIRDIGCSIQEFKVYIESKFQQGMTWENWSLKGWHLDHIRPLASFNLSDREQFLQAIHFTNYQPLWAKDNLSKGAR